MPKGIRKHKWVPACQLLSSETGNYLVCKRCGVVQRADGANKDKPCVDRRIRKDIAGLLRKK